MDGGSDDRRGFPPTGPLKIGAARSRPASCLYRYRSFGEALGFRLASEISSDIEFCVCLEVFRAFPASYGIASGAEEKIGFYLIHAQVEPMHGRTSMAAVEAHLRRHPLAELSIKRGATVFMQTYGRFFEALNKAVRTSETEFESVA